jgi:hypothetical protein
MGFFFNMMGFFFNRPGAKDSHDKKEHGRSDPAASFMDSY